MLVFSYIGYLPEKVAVSGQSVINAKLSKDIKKLEEVVVIGYGTQKIIILSFVKNFLWLLSVKYIYQ
jgi:hypothetical protein